MSDVNLPTYREYRTRVTNLATYLAEEYDACEREIEDAIHDTVFVHEYVRLFKNAVAVLLHTDNRDAYWDSCGPNIEADTSKQVVCELAAFAMLQDVRDALPDALQAYRASKPT